MSMSDVHRDHLQELNTGGRSLKFCTGDLTGPNAASLAATIEGPDADTGCTQLGGT